MGLDTCSEIDVPDVCSRHVVARDETIRLDGMHALPRVSEEAYNMTGIDIDVVQMYMQIA